MPRQAITVARYLSIVLTLRPQREPDVEAGRAAEPRGQAGAGGQAGSVRVTKVEIGHVVRTVKSQPDPVEIAPDLVAVVQVARVVARHDRGELARDREVRIDGSGCAEADSD